MRLPVRTRSILLSLALAASTLLMSVATALADGASPPLPK